MTFATTKTFRTILAAILICGASLPVAAAPQGEPIVSRIEIRTGDLDLGNQADRDRLDRRLRWAAREVCGTGYGFDLNSRNEARRCVQQALETVEMSQGS
ncbi:UrcA family protein [Parasphingopyxis marina]|uniref:UrcA family protein n=1 Tax=Parasphingopyxis marina TaxID=2761622 RepID=A0A842HVS4_9SPHN|nr:UrcA family protein [Parasphingopyxis marina]MBC2778148.1 UrcA family protein [Parasphingopyxis marina]